MNPPISGQNMAELYDGALLLDAVDPSSGYAWSARCSFGDGNDHATCIRRSCLKTKRS
jgi:hypothetical protein